MSKKPTKAENGEHTPKRHGGAYEEGKRLEGPAPDYGFVRNAAGDRVPAGPDGKPADGSAPFVDSEE